MLHLGGEKGGGGCEEEEELIFPLWEKHMLDLKSWRESSHLALIGIKRVGGRAERMRGKEMPRLLLMIYCVKCERRYGGCLSFKLLCRGIGFMSVSFTKCFIRYERPEQLRRRFHRFPEISGDKNFGTSNSYFHNQLIG